MNLLAAMDVLDGQVTRLHKGRFGEATSYGSVQDGIEFLKKGGATHLHLIDLNAARDPKDRANARVISQTLAGWSGWVEIGGGIRTIESIDRALESGVDRVIVGTAAILHPELLVHLDAATTEQIVVALDYSHVSGKRQVAYNGWVAMDPPSFAETLTRVLDSGVSAILATAIERDGTLTEPDYETYQELIDSYHMSVIASGGVSSIASLSRLASLEGTRGKVESAVVGKAIWDQTFTIAEGIRACHTSA